MSVGVASTRNLVVRNFPSLHNRESRYHKKSELSSVDTLPKIRLGGIGDETRLHIQTDKLNVSALSHGNIHSVYFTLPRQFLL